MAKADDAALLELEGHTVRVSHPGKLYFSPASDQPAGATLSKLELVQYFLAVAPGALRGIADRPLVLKRFVNGASLAGTQPEPFYQKRAPADLPPFLRTVTLSFPSGRTADEVVIDNTAALAWVINLGCIELHPHPVRTGNLDHPDELRIDLDPGPGILWPDVRAVALEVQALLAEVGLTGWPKTSGSRGMHINVRIEPRWTFTEVRRAALALARAVERRAPSLASSKWWKEERHGVFLDYNQNAKDRTTASAFSVRPLPDARVSTPLLWDEVPSCEPADFTVRTVPARFSTLGDPHANMASAVGTLDGLLDLAARDEHEGLGDAPWPPHFAKGEGEGPRVAPSRARKSFSSQIGEGFGPQRFRKRAKALDPVEPSAAAPAGASPAEPSSPASSAGEGTPSSAAPAPPKVPRTRKSSKPLIIVAQSPDRPAIDAALERWKQAHAEAATHLQPADILVDRMRGSAYIWYRLRLNLEHIPEPLRPPQETIDPDDDPTRH